MANIAFELFLLSTNLSQFKSKVLITKLFIESINSLFEEHEFIWSSEDCNIAETKVQVCTRFKNYGYIHFNKQSTFTNESFSLFQNAIQLLAIQLEKIEQEELLQNQKEHLNILVQEKTKDLIESQNELIKQNNEYAALNEEYKAQNEALLKANEKTEESENRLRLATKSGQLGIWDWNVKEDTMIWDERMFELYGITVDTFPNNFDAWANGLHPEDKQEAINECNLALDGEKEYNTTFRVVQPNGTILYIKADGIIIRDSENKPIRMIGINKDITDHKQSEIKLQQNKAIIRNKLKAITEPDGDMTTLELSDIIDIQMLQSLLEDFYKLTGILGAILDISGKVLVAVGWQDICTKFHRCHPDTQRNCIESDTILTHGVPVGTSRIYRCKNNMYDMVTPLMIGNRHMGNVFIGQFFHQNEKLDVELFRKQAKQYGFDETEYLTALNKVPRFSQQTIDAGIQFYAKLAKIISTLSYSTIQQSRLLAERTQSEEALKQSEEKYRLLAENSSDVIWVLNLNRGKFSYISPAIDRLRGLTVEEALNESMDDALTPESLELVTSMLNRDIPEFIKNQDNPFYSINEVRQPHKNGSLVWVEISSRYRMNENGEIEIIGVSRNITERKQAKERLKRSEEQFRYLYENATIGIYRTTPEGKILLANPFLIEMLGYNSFEELSKINLSDQGFVLDLPRDQFIKNIEKEGSIHASESVWKRKDGSSITISESARVQRDFDGKTLYYEGMVLNITERKRLENEIERERLLLKDLINTQPTGIYRLKVRPAEQWSADTWNAEMRSHYSVELVSDRFCEILGITTTDFITNPGLIPDIIHPDDSASFNRQNADAVNTKTTFRWEGRVIVKKEIRWIYFESIPRDIGNGEMIWSGIIQDITERKQAEEALTQEKDFIEALLESIPGMLYVYDEKGTHIRHNKKHEEMTGYSNEELSHMNPLSWYDNMADVVRVEAAINDVFTKGSGEVVVPIQIKNGKKPIMQFTGSLLIQDSKKYFVGVGIDITDRKQAEEEIRSKSEKLSMLLKIGNLLASSHNTNILFQEIVEGAAQLSKMGSCAIYTLEGDNIHLKATSPALPPDFNEVFRTSSLSDHPHISRAISSMLPVILHDTKSANLTPAEINICESRQLRSVAYIPLTYNQRTIGVLIVGSVNQVHHFSDEEIEVLHILANQASLEIEETSLFEEKQHNVAQLEQQILERKRVEVELIGAKKEAEENDRLKSAFLANMSHEIRTPLNSILGFTELICDPDSEIKQRLDYAQLITTSGNNLLSIINDILDISKIEAGQMQIRTTQFSAQNLVLGIQKEFEIRASQKGTNLTIAPSTSTNTYMLESDEPKLKQVLINFVSNAIKFTDNGFIEIGLKLTENSIQFHVKDDGIGIAAEFHDHIFERFRQVETFSTRKYGGNGLGLPISKSLVEMLGGTIWVESELGKGSTFCFSLPIV